MSDFDGEAKACFKKKLNKAIVKLCGTVGRSLACRFFANFKPSNVMCQDACLAWSNENFRYLEAESAFLIIILYI